MRHREHPVLRSVLFLLAWSLFALLLIWQKRATLQDPHYWDSLGCYIAQARLLALNGFNLAAYHGVGFIRPPLYTGILASVLRTMGNDRGLLRIVTCLFGALTLPAVFVITRRLGGTVRAAALAALLCLLAPLFQSQAGLLQSDLPATALSTLAWALLLGGHTRSFALCASLAVLTKESTYFLCLPAAVYLYSRGTAASLYRKLLPAALPGFVLFAWEVGHRILVGHLFHTSYLEAIGPNHIINALVHNFFEGGRFLLFAFAAVSTWRAASRVSTTPPFQRVAILCTALAAVALPFAFPAPLPRYMLPSLPFFCALTALEIDRLRSGKRLAVATALCAFLILCWNGKSWHNNQGHHLDSNLIYRRLLFMQKQAAESLAAASPRGVLATFPMFTVLSAPPEDGFLAAPLPVRFPQPSMSIPELCQNDYLIEAEQGDSVHAVLARLLTAGAKVSLWRRFSDEDMDFEFRIQIYRIDCAGIR